MHELLVLSYGAICRGLLSGSMKLDRRFDGDDLRRSDPKFQLPRFRQYLRAADRLGEHAGHGKSRLAFAMRWTLDRGETMTLAIFGPILSMSQSRPDCRLQCARTFLWSFAIFQRRKE